MTNGGSQNPSTGTLTGLRVLLVEDESIIAMFVEDTLEELGCKVVAAASRLDQALQHAETVAADLAIIDVNLDGKPSYPVAQVLANRGIPFVIATGYGSGSLPPGFETTPVLQKPFEQSGLEQAIASALRNAAFGLPKDAPPVAGQGAT